MVDLLIKVGVTISIPITFIIKILSSFSDHFYGRLSGQSFIFNRYTKHLIILQNGHGILVHKFIVRILRKSKFESISRFLKINDACKDTVFDKIYKMQNARISDRFDKMGFWYEPKDLIKNIIKKVDNKSKELEWEFIFDNARIAESKLRIIPASYAFSLPGMFPITDGYYDPDLSPLEVYDFSSSMTIKHKMKKLRYTVEFDKMIKLNKAPVFEIYPRGFDHYHKTLIGKDISDIIYNRFIVEISSPRLGSTIKVLWSVESKQ